MRAMEDGRLNEGGLLLAVVEERQLIAEVLAEVLAELQSFCYAVSQVCLLVSFNVSLLNQSNFLSPLLVCLTPHLLYIHGFSISFFPFLAQQPILCSTLPLIFIY
jgi:hypothetical protein